MVLKCDVKKDIRYSRPNPKFHHWHIGDKRFGLTFERYDDARAFDRGVRSAVADLTDGEYSNLMRLRNLFEFEYYHTFCTYHFISGDIWTLKYPIFHYQGLS